MISLPRYFVVTTRAYSWANDLAMVLWDYDEITFVGKCSCWGTWGAQQGRFRGKTHLSRSIGREVGREGEKGMGEKGMGEKEMGGRRGEGRMRVLNEIKKGECDGASSLVVIN